ncbi:hypothetical protein RRG08_015908 [Elysia crispata]|uniref:Uncharacterized protein n=1 Tax=Elysia crispata TaxID=231223 RepID=A0AAE1E143_9GAST|nr:hypothetical protein RRG08_015908 [Elysia crispata]
MVEVQGGGAGWNKLMCSCCRVIVSVEEERSPWLGLVSGACGHVTEQCHKSTASYTRAVIGLGSSTAVQRWATGCCMNLQETLTGRENEQKKRNTKIMKFTGLSVTEALQSNSFSSSLADWLPVVGLEWLDDSRNSEMKDTCTGRANRGFQNTLVSYEGIDHE